MVTDLTGLTGLQSLDAKVAALKQPGTYPDNPRHIEARETHKSWVFLTDTNAYKLKKPILFNAVNFTSLEARRQNCLEEVRLNRRLATDIYLGVVPLTLGNHGKMVVAGTGTVIEWLVNMRRLPDDRILEQILHRGEVTDHQLRSIANVLSRFYASSSPAITDPSEYRSILASEIRVNLDAFSVIGGQHGNLSAIALRCGNWLNEMLESRSECFERRVRQGKIVEYHGDLRPAHICLLDDGPVFFDCLEFDRRLRLGDPVDELGFLSLECERLGLSPVGWPLLDEYQRVTGDAFPGWLNCFYRVYRATIWARLAFWRNQGNEDQDSKWIDRAREYLRLADRYSRELDRPH